MEKNRGVWMPEEMMSQGPKPYLGILGLPNLFSYRRSYGASGLQEKRFGCFLFSLLITLVSCASPSPQPEAQRSLPEQTAHKKPKTGAYGEDISRYPAAYPEGEWLPIIGSLLSRRLEVEIQVQGQTLLAILDTGAMSTTLTSASAARIGIRQVDYEAGETTRISDAHGVISRGYRMMLKDMQIGDVRIPQYDVLIVEQDRELFLIGWNILKDFDLFLVADEGLVGLFPKGRGPRLPGASTVTLNLLERSAAVTGRAKGAEGEVSFELILDTGAMTTAIPILKGLEGGLPADIHFQEKYEAVNSEREERGRFLLTPFMLGEERFKIPSLYAIASTLRGGRGPGLLGNDILMAYNTVINVESGHLYFADKPRRPAFRDFGPGGQTCENKAGEQIHCIEVRLVAGEATAAEQAYPPLSLEAKVDARFGPQTIELLVLAYDEKNQPIFHGGGLRIFLTIGNKPVHQTFALWNMLGQLGLTSDAQLELRFVRTAGIVWPCDPMHIHCLSFSGPLVSSEKIWH
jgi:clan AA aspartic protease (TIGR02281 family)